MPDEPRRPRDGARGGYGARRVHPVRNLRRYMPQGRVRHAFSQRVSWSQGIEEIGKAIVSDEKIASFELIVVGLKP